MQFALVGTIGSQAGELIWQDGALSGNTAFVAQLRELAGRLEGFPVGPPCGPFTEHVHLTDPLSTRVLIESHLFTTVISRHGEIPLAPDVPEGAVA